MAERDNEERLFPGDKPRISNRYTAIRIHRKPLKTKGATNF
jgi:hypothetical protein